MTAKHYDCIVIGAGHAGLEAALAPSRMGCLTLLVNISFETIGEMSCNPAIGGVGKGQLVKEIDALGGEMGKSADATGIQFRQLNASKGAAVRSSRCQSDRKGYRLYMQNVISHQEHLDFKQAKVSDILVEDGKVIGIRTEDNETIHTKTIVIAAGTFLNGKIHIGTKTFPAGRIDELNSTRLPQSLKDLGFQLMSFKTGTPPRLDGKTIDFSQMVRQDSDARPVPFSFLTKEILKAQKLMPCYITATNERTHDIIRANLHLSPMYSGRIKSTGVRYCPSIEDKLVKFASKKQHHVFLEPEGLETDLYYPNGISTGLPEDVQEQMIHSIAGLEHVSIVRFGYSIEHDVILSTELRATLESKRIHGLFFAGQINGTTGYEEAAAQGLVAGINAALKVRGEEPFILRRDESYIGVLIDDLVTKGTEEPYRMFTSRVEYRLIVREDNADKRMCEYAYRFGLMKEECYQQIKQKYAIIEKMIARLRQTPIRPGTEIDDVLVKNNSAPLRNVTTLGELLKRPEISFDMITRFSDEGQDYPREVIEQIEYEIKYEGFIARQLKDVEKFKHLENIKIPDDLDYASIPGVSKEIQHKLKVFNPMTLGQAHRISGVTPAAISILMIYLKKRNDEKNHK
jgi:tRNA uridine 5-carboxymethylaminomethyl modification enzyme